MGCDIDGFCDEEEILLGDIDDDLMFIVDKVWQFDGMVWINEGVMLIIEFCICIEGIKNLSDFVVFVVIWGVKIYVEGIVNEFILFISN